MIRARSSPCELASRLLAVALLAGSALAAAQQENPTSRAPPVLASVAFGVAPVSGLEDAPQLQPRSGDVIYRADRLRTNSRNDRELEARAAAGEGWRELFARLGQSFGDGLLSEAAASAELHLLPALFPGKYVRLRMLSGERAIQIDYVAQPDETYSILVTPTGVRVQRNGGSAQVLERMRSDASKASLFTATDAIGLHEDIALQLAEIFSDDVDFHRDLHHGYRCVVVFEMQFSREGYIDRPGRIVAAEITLRGRRLQAFYFEGHPGRAGYFNEAGMSLKKVFRRSPVEFSRVTSEYTLARFHPVLGLWRAHRGIDYAAPVGTRVLATSDGVVDFMGWRGELGNLLILNHSGRFRTLYGHLDSFAKELSVGATVAKGQVIGLVGMTGLTTGPHLHYEFHLGDGAGQWSSVPPPQMVEIPPITTPEFAQAVRAYQDHLQVAESAHFVILD